MHKCVLLFHWGLVGSRSYYFTVARDLVVVVRTDTVLAKERLICLCLGSAFVSSAPKGQTELGAVAAIGMRWRSAVTTQVRPLLRPRRRHPLAAWTGNEAPVVWVEAIP